MVLIYQCFISLYVWGIRVAARWNPKAAAWVNGRKNLLTKLKAARNPSDRLIWVHCASAGELEQGKPLISKLRETYPDHKVLISFFSPSGMAILGFPIIIPQLLLLMKVSSAFFDLRSVIPLTNILILLASNGLVVLLAIILFPFLWKD